MTPKLGNGYALVASTRLFLQPRKVWRDWVSSRHDSFKLIISLLVRQHHAAQVEVHVFGKVAWFIGIV